MSEILAAWQKRDANLRGFFQQYGDVRLLIDSLVLAARSVISGSHEIPSLSHDRVIMLQCWRTVYDYQQESLFLLLGKQLDGGLALLRLATELSRDVLRMSEDIVNFEMWMKKSELRHKGCYRNTFKFKEQDKLESYVHGLYNAFSNLGVHGHMTSLSQSSSAGLTPCGKFELLTISEKELLKSLSFWCFSFFPIQELCLRVFEQELAKHAPEALAAFLNLMEATAPAIKSLGEAWGG